MVHVKMNLNLSKCSSFIAKNYANFTSSVMCVPHNSEKYKKSFDS
jgi:hypothetical protein